MFVPLICCILPALTSAPGQSTPSPGDLTVGITLSCPYGLGTCYPDIRAALARMPGLEWLSQSADAGTWTCRMRMADSKLLRPSDMSAYLQGLRAGATLRGIEATVAGRVEVQDGQYYLVSRSTWIPLERYAHPVYWDVPKKRAQAVSPAERGAYARFIDAESPGDPVIVTGPLQDPGGDEAPALEVRSFRKWQGGAYASDTAPGSKPLFASLPAPQQQPEEPVARPEGPTPDATPAKMGRWTEPQSVIDAAVHTQMLPTGNILYNSTCQPGEIPNLWLYTPAGKSIQLANPPLPTFCSGHTILNNGTVFYAGGQGVVGNAGAGNPQAAIYDPFTNTWNSLPDMGVHRWYPTVVQLPNDDVLVLSGSEDEADGALAFVPQIWNGSSWVNLTGAKSQIALYPNAYVEPSGLVFVAGPDQQSMYLDPSGKGSWEPGPMRTFPSRAYGPTVMYRPGKILYVGGGTPATATSEQIDLTAPNPQWTAMAPMHYARRHANATVLPDGTVFVNGGTHSDVFDDPTEPDLTPELWIPTTNTWAPMAPQKIYRGYHSTAVLMPDGRVFSSGGQTFQTVEIYSPPYLFKGPRPTVTSAPSLILDGRTFQVGCPAASSVSAVSLIKLGSATHTLNHDENFQYLKFDVIKNSLLITAPAVSPLTPAGYYMLFVLSNQGVPSVADIVQLIGPTKGIVNPPAPK